MIYDPLDFHLFGKTVDFLSCLIGDFVTQPSQPLPRILQLSNTRVSVLPDEEELLVAL